MTKLHRIDNLCDQLVKYLTPYSTVPHNSDAFLSRVREIVVSKYHAIYEGTSAGVKTLSGRFFPLRNYVEMCASNFYPLQYSIELTWNAISERQTSKGGDGRGVGEKNARQLVTIRNHPTQLRTVCVLFFSHQGQRGRTERAAWIGIWTLQIITDWQRKIRILRVEKSWGTCYEVLGILTIT